MNFRLPLAARRGRSRRARPGSGPITRTLLATGRTLRRDHSCVGAIVDGLGPEGIGLALLLLTLPTLIPVPGPFGMAFGSLIALVAVQAMAGARRLWLPAALRRRPAPVRILRAVIAGALPWIARAEGILRERRLAALTGRRARIVLALPLLLLALAIILPIPFGNFAPALALIAFALGFMARDGLAILLALGLSVAALAWAGLLLVVGTTLFDWGAGLVGF